ARTPYSTLYPYTSLFRSLFERFDQRCPVGVQPVDQRAPAPLGGAGPVLAAFLVDLRVGVERGQRLIGHRRDRGGEVTRGAGGNGDRKSTRLNSSHVIISY